MPVSPVGDQATGQFVQPEGGQPELQDYFPVTLDASRFVYVRWTIRTDHHDWVWFGSLDALRLLPARRNCVGDRVLLVYNHRE